jgi:hypothetical protein
MDGNSSDRSTRGEYDDAAAVSPEGRAVKRCYASSSKGKQTRAHYAATPKSRAYQAANYAPTMFRDPHALAQSILAAEAAPRAS